MARPRRDGTPARAVNKHKLTDPFVKSEVGPPPGWSGTRSSRAWRSPSGCRASSWKVIYRFTAGWSGITSATRGDRSGRGAEQAQEIMLEVIGGQGPGSRAQGGARFGHLRRAGARLRRAPREEAQQELEASRAARHQHLLPRWGKLKAHAITRADVRAVMLRIDAPIVANQVLASASAIFSWAMKQEIVTVNPCKLVDRTRPRTASGCSRTPRSRCSGRGSTRSLKLILLTGQRPGEVAAMQRSTSSTAGGRCRGSRRATGRGPRTARDHRVWLSEPARA